LPTRSRGAASSMLLSSPSQDWPPSKYDPEAHFEVVDSTIPPECLGRRIDWERIRTERLLLLLLLFLLPRGVWMMASGPMNYMDYPADPPTCGAGGREEFDVTSVRVIVWRALGWNALLSRAWPAAGTCAFRPDREALCGWPVRQRAGILRVSSLTGARRIAGCASGTSNLPSAHMFSLRLNAHFHSPAV
jgi:hypothetical protein